MNRFQPRDHLTESDIHEGLRQVVRNGVASQAMSTVTGGVFLVAFALQLGASNFVIGLLAGLPPLVQVIQIPAIYLVERIRKRKWICFVSCLISRSCLLLMASIPLLVTGHGALVFLFVGLLIYTAFAAISGCSWNTWMRDLIPEDRMGAFFSRRMAISMAMGIVLSLLAAAYLDLGPRWFPGYEVYAYALLFAIGFLLGMLEAFFLTRIPEPTMSTATEKRNFFRVLQDPFRDENFRKLLIFSGSWSFAIHLAVPFFTVYLLNRLGFPMSMVIGLNVLMQLFNVLFFKIFGNFSDRFSNKSVLAVSGPLFLFCILAWTFTTLPEKHLLTIPLLVVIFVFMGISTAGTTLAAGNIGLKLAPRGQATAYLAANNLTNAVAASIAPMIGGKFADFFSTRSLEWTLKWTSPGEDLTLRTLHLQHWDFFFFLAFLLGLYAMHRLSMVAEIGEVDENVVLDAMLADATRPMSMFYRITGFKRILKTTIRIKKELLQRPSDSTPSPPASDPPEVSS